MGEHGDFGRRYVLDPVMLPRALAARPATVLDVGCGEGRFCRMLKTHGVAAMGIDPTRNLLAAAHQQDPTEKYFEGEAASLPFDDASFNLVVSYLSLVDIPDVVPAIAETTLVPRHGVAESLSADSGVQRAAIARHARWGLVG